MSNIGHRSLFNQLLSNLLVDDTRDLVILLDDRSLSDHHFRTMIALKTTLFQKNSSRHTSRFKVRNLRKFLKVIFLHLLSAIRTRWSLIVQFSDDFLFYYRLYRTFFYNRIGSIISIGDLPTTNIIEPKK